MAPSGIEEILKLLSRKELSDEERAILQKKIKGILQKALRSIPNPSLKRQLARIYGEDFMEELTQEFLLKLYSTLSLFQSKDSLSETYLVKMARNMILFLLAKERVSLHSEHFSTLSPANPDREEEEIEYFDRISGIQFVNDYLKDFIIEGVWQALKNSLTEKEWEALCFYLYKIENREVAGISQREKNTLYKRWERLKPKLRNILALYLENTEDHYNYWQEIVEKIRSEFCKKSD